MELLKQRLLGAIVFFSLAIIFLPEIFNDKGSTVFLADGHGSATLPYQAALAQHSTKAGQEVSAYKVAAQESQDDSAWSVRVGAFSDPAVAVHLEKKLRQNGYAAYIQSQDGNLHHVLVGPELVASNAHEVRERLEQHLQLSGVVVGAAA